MKKILFALISLLTFNTMVLATDLSPISQSYYDKAVKFYQAGDVTSAKQYFFKVIAIEPNYSDAYYNLGAIAENEDKIEKAVYFYKRALSINTEDNGVKYRLGACLNTLNNQKEATRYLVEIPNNAPEYQSARIVLNKINPDKYPLQPKEVKKTTVAKTQKKELTPAQKIQNLEAQVKQQKNELKKQKDLLSCQEKQLEKQQTEIADKNTKIQNMNEKEQQFTVKIVEQANIITQQNRQLNDLKNLILQNENDLEKLQNKSNDKNVVYIEQLKSTIQKQNQDVLALENKIKQITKISNDKDLSITEQNKKIVELNNLCSQTNEKLGQQQIYYKNQVNELNNEIIKLNKEINNKPVENINDEKIKELNTKITSQTTTITEQNKKIEELTQQQTSSQNKINELNNEITKLIQEKSDKPVINTNDEKIKELNTKITSQTTTINEQNKKIENLNNEIKNNLKTIETQKKELQQKTVAIEDLQKNQNTKVENVIKDDKNDKNIEKLNVRIQDLTALVATNKITISTKDEEIKKLNNQIKQNKKTIKQQENDITNLTAKVNQTAKKSEEPQSKKIVETNFGVMEKIMAPTGIAKDDKGNTYVASFADNIIYQIDNTNKKTIFAKDELISGPIGLAFDENKNLYIANYNNDNVLKLDKNGKLSVFIEKCQKPYYLYVQNNALYITEQETNSIIKEELK